MTVELITRYAKILILFAIIWAGIWFWNTEGCRKVPGAEMEPTFKRDKWVRTDPRRREPGIDLERGDAVFYGSTIPARRQQTEFLSRVVGVPGDRIKIVKGEVYVNGDKAQESVPVDQRGVEDFEEALVPRDCVFVLGDNRGNSGDCDSRGIGPVPKWAILGKVR